MKVSNNYNLSQFSNKNLTSFKKESLNKSFVKKMLPKTMYVLLPLSILCTMCSKTENRVTEKTSFNNSNVEYFNVKESTKNIIENSLKNFEQKAKDINFLDGMKIDITKRYENLDDKDSYRRFLKQQKNVDNVHGSSFYSDNVIPKRVCVQEAAHNDDKIRNLLHNLKFSSLESIDFTLMHELGHQFDKYYGHDCDADFVQKREAMLSRYANQDSLSVYKMPSVKKDIMTELIYSDNSGLSDKKQFKEAFLMDLQNIAQIKKQGSDDLASNINYFIAGIDFDKEINERTVFIHDGSRAEVYANLFSYAVGKDDGEKEVFTQNFKNSYEIVKSDVLKYLGI